MVPNQFHRSSMLSVCKEILTRRCYAAFEWGVVSIIIFNFLEMVLWCSSLTSVDFPCSTSNPYLKFEKYTILVAGCGWYDGSLYTYAIVGKIIYRCNTVNAMNQLLRILAQRNQNKDLGCRFLFSPWLILILQSNK